MEILEVDKNWLLDRANEENEKVKASAARAACIIPKRGFFSSWLDNADQLREKDKDMKNELNICAESSAKLNFNG